MVWEYLFDNDHKQRDDINQALSETTVALDLAQNLARRLEASEARVQKLELTVEALVRLLAHQKQLDPNALALTIQRIDLEDGVEDGVMGPDRSKTAPKCPCCGRPVNPRRDTCLFCGIALTGEAESHGGPYRASQSELSRNLPREIMCSRCAKSVPESGTYITEYGVLCEECWADSIPT